MDVIDVTLRVTAALERTGIGYFLGGSLASSLQGEPRSTNDIDLVVDLPAPKVAELVAALGPDFDVDEEALGRAARERSSWNVFFLPLLTKIDLFVLREGAFDVAEFQRRRPIEVRPGQRLFVKSPEDSVLRKLLWYRDGGSVSERQWRDVVQVLRLSRGALDEAYLDDWGHRLRLADLLARARDEALRPAP
ncbi:MAG TPA: hypothetical protein VEB43_18255 [Anaeromyxobacter sp.]|nr:hypothetical protein [Anaeromyxobacter sp.]